MSASRRLRSTSAGIATLVVLAGVAACGGSSGSPGRMGRPGLANVWVDHDGGSCTRSDAAGAYVDGRACATFGAAYLRAEPGDRVLIAGGSYPAQRVGVDPDKVRAANDVTFQPAPGGDVRLKGDLTVAGSHLRLVGSAKPYDFHLRYAISEATAAATSSRNVTFENLDGAGFVIGPTEHIAIRGGDWGPNVLTCGGRDQYENKITPLDTFPGRVPRDILLDGLLIHDQSSTDLKCQHMGGLGIVSADGLTIRNTRWSQAAVYDIEVGDFTGRFGNPRDVVIENNWFGAPVLQDGTTNDGQPELQLAEPGRYDTWLIRFNSFVNGLALDLNGGAEPDGVRVIGNVGQHPNCQGIRGGVSWADNVWTDPGCGPTDRRIARLPYEDSTPGRDNLHLVSSEAQDVVRDTTLRRDIDGDRRPVGRASDAGADER